MRRNDQGHECRKNRECFHFRAPFWLKTPLRRYARHCFLKLTRKPPQRIGPRLKRSLFISMMGVLSNGKFGYHRSELAKSDAIGAGLNLGVQETNDPIT